jgi:hypothetical protein
MSVSATVTQKVTIYLGIPILTAGVVGDLINIIVFLSLQTFRQNSCAFYLTTMSIVNIGHLITGLLSRIMISGFNIDWTETSLFYCKFRPYCLQSCILISFTCMCLATIDQFLATCSNPRWQLWNNIKIARRLTLGFTLIWLLHGIPYWIYYNQLKSDTTNLSVCRSTNDIFGIYYIGGFTIVLGGLLPICITILFGLLAYRNIRNITYRTISLVRRELDKQLTVIVLFQMVYIFITITPYLIVNILLLNATITKDSVKIARLDFAYVLTICLFYLNFAVSEKKYFLFFLAFCIFVDSILYVHVRLWTIS